MKREYKFNQEIREQLSEFYFHFYRVENHSMEPGMPDIHFLTADGLSGWIEVKDSDSGMVKMPSKVKYEKGQVPWLVEYDKRGGFCCTIIRYYLEGKVWIGVIAGKDSAVAEQSLLKSPMACFDPMSRWCWSGIAELIRDGARRALWQQRGFIPAHPGQYIRESQEQDLVGAVIRQRKGL
jgi:hypothetical protein